MKNMNADELEEELQKVLDVESYNGLTPEEVKYQIELLKLLNDKQPKLVERIPEELRFIKRFVNLKIFKRNNN